MDVPQVAVAIGFLGHHLAELGRHDAQNVAGGADHDKRQGRPEHDVGFHLLRRSHQSVADEHQVEARFGEGAVQMSYGAGERRDVLGETVFGHIGRRKMVKIFGREAPYGCKLPMIGVLDSSVQVGHTVVGLVLEI